MLGELLIGSFVHTLLLRIFQMENLRLQRRVNLIRTVVANAKNQQFHIN